MITALEMLSVWTVEEGGASARASRVSQALRCVPGGYSLRNSCQSEQQTQERGEWDERGSTHHAASTKRRNVNNSGEEASDDVFIAPSQQYRDPVLATLSVDAPNDATAMGVGVKQAWVRAFVWYHARPCRPIPVDVLVDTGVGGGNYSST